MKVSFIRFNSFYAVGIIVVCGFLLGGKFPICIMTFYVSQ
jgi:hypothetical protein